MSQAKMGLLSASSWVTACLLLASTVSAAVLGTGPRLVPPPLTDDRGSHLRKRMTGQGVFQQQIDHSDPSLGTFAQSFWWSDEFYAGPGSPVIFFTPGESAADRYTGYLTNQTITGAFAQAVGGAIVMLEHRYWGGSSPVEELTTRNLRYHTLENAILDTTNFAANVKLPFDANGSSSAANAPWVFSGGSYSGALSAWTQAKAPGTFWAHHASSAVVEAVGDFWQYFRPVRLGMPANCSADVTRVIEHVDSVLKTGSDEEKQTLKERFGLEDIVHDDDFAGALENGPWLWQSHDFGSGYSWFFEFCDYVENMWFGSNATAPGPDGVGLDMALEGYAKWVKEELIPGYCAGYGYWRYPDDLGCFDTHNASNPLFTDVSLGNAVNRQWNWFLCNEPFKYWQDGAPDGEPTLVSRLINKTYWEQQCGLLFPPEDGFTYGINKGLDVGSVNDYTGGWSRPSNATKRIVYVNGEFDPWRDATVSSVSRPGGPLESTPDTPVYDIPGGIHCSDLIVTNGEIDEGVARIIQEEVEIIKAWVESFYVEKGLTMPGRNH